MQQWVTAVLLGLLLAGSAWLDIKRREVSTGALLLFSALGLLLYIGFRQFGILSLIGGISIGLLLMAVSRLTKGGIGIGDGGVLCVSGMYLGFYKNMTLLLTALFLAAVCGACLLVAGKAGRKTELPFVPFLAAAYAGMLLF